MSKPRSPKPNSDGADELRPEYHFDYRKSRPNRFAARFRARGRVAVLLDDVSEVFATPEAVNRALRALIAVVPRKKAGAREK